MISLSWLSTYYVRWSCTFNNDRYVDGLTGVVLARSPPIRVTNQARLLVQDISYHFFEKFDDSRQLRLASAGRSKSVTLPSDKESVTVSSSAVSKIVSDIAVGSTQLPFILAG
ncbi:unnamed protein product [Heligmosomoides polygyrus]|uniref:CPSF_A domain-containing protein n=1 Tax=Heligmosomoides polygyrus TaxID=6339 RepID=A0A183F347_HELPZ|nr:unnamed protein product [Heligmosomoides polygyrus]